MGATLSRGTTQLREWIGEYLSTTIPPMVVQALGDWSLESWQLPVPLVYDTYDLPIASQFPSLGSDFPNETNHVRTDWTDRAEQEYWSNQAGSVYVWVATPVDPDDKLELPYRETAMRLRDDLSELVRQALLLHPDLGQGQGTCWMEETALSVNRMDPFRAAENRPDWVAGTLIPVMYRVKSELSLDPLGMANTIDFEARKLEDV